MAEVAPTVLIVEARYYDDITDELVRGVVAALEQRGVAYDRVTVPGALEIPIALSLAAHAGHFDGGGRYEGCIALGCVIRGETAHYDIVAQESAHALMRLATEYSVPTGNGILTVDDRDQAWARASVDGKNKGGDAASACLALMNLRAHFAQTGSA
ncbi:MAG: 6,7-dimethyl-8-ribityllumazine synthase [Methyloligellaceae bacterium]